MAADHVVSAVRRLAWPALLALFGLAVWVAAWNLHRPRGYWDTFDYTSVALQAAGYDRVSADKAAIRFAHGYTAPGFISDPPVYDARLESRTFEPRRYRAIFDSRPLYPRVAALFVPWFGVNAMIVASALGGWLFAVALGLSVELLTQSKLLSLAAVAAAFALPLGVWLIGLLAEGWMLAFWTAGLGLATAYARQRRLSLLTAFGLACVLLALTKSTNAVPLAIALLTIALFALVGRCGSAAALLHLAAVASGVVVAAVAVTAWLGLPGFKDGVQDLLTEHFTKPDVASPWLPLARLAFHGTIEVVRDAAPALWLILAFAAIPLLRAARGAVVLWAVAAAASMLLFVIHPATSEMPRYLAPVWISVVIGLVLWPRMVSAYLARGRQRVSVHTDETPDLVAGGPRRLP